MVCLHSMNNGDDLKWVLHFVIPLPPITKKNSSQIVRFGKRSALIPSKQYKKYEAESKEYCIPYNIDYPINIECLYYMKTRREVDITNLHSASHDILTKHNVIADDNCTIVVSTDGSRVFYDKENPRTEITISRTERTFNK